jgi:hypothetical protein
MHDPGCGPLGGGAHETAGAQHHTSHIGERRSSSSSGAWLGYLEATPRFHEREALGEYLEPMHYRVGFFRVTDSRRRAGGYGQAHPTGDIRYGYTSPVV